MSRELSSDDFRLLVDSVEDYAIFILDVHGCVASWNRGARRIKGYTAEEILGRHFSTFYTAEDLAAGKPERELEIVREQGRVEDEGWRIRKDGTKFWAIIVITALRGPNGELRGFGKVTRDLTQRRMAEEELRRSEERFRLLVEGVGDYAIYMLDPEGRVTTWNAGAATIKGYSTDEILGRHFSAFFTAEDIRDHHPERELEAARATGRFEEEGWRVRKDGSRFWASVIVAALRDSHGELVGFAKVTRDLTARRIAEETERRLIREQAARAAAQEGEIELRLERERFRALSRRLEAILEGVADGITVQDRTGALQFANTAAARVCGFATVEELLQAPTADVVSRFQLFDERGEPFDAARLPGRRVLAGAGSATSLIRIYEKASGTWSWNSVRASAVLGEDGRAELAVNIWHDITEDRLREEHERFLARVTASVTSSLDYDQTLRRAARAPVPTLGDFALLEVLEGEKPLRLAAAHEDPEANKLLEALLASSTTDAIDALWSTAQTRFQPHVDDEWLVKTAGSAARAEILRGLRVTSWLSLPLVARGQPLGTLTMCFGTSARHHSTEDLRVGEELARRVATAVDQAALFLAARAAAQRAEEAARRAEEAGRIKDEFLATVSHELRTPLNSILGWASVLRERTSHPSLGKGLTVIHRNAQAQAKIIDDILDVSRIITGKLRLELRPADLVTIVRDAIEVVRPSANAKSISIIFAPADELCLLVADPERLQQVMWNLLSNAVKFTDPGGTITISVRRDGSSLVASVSDTGRGIDAEFLPYVFDRFKQADSSTTRTVGGLGLGLAIVRHILELHGGHVDVHSAGKGTGTTFTVRLPVRAVAPAPTDEPHPASTARPSVVATTRPSLVGARVLVVDDEPDARDLLQAVLLDAGATVQTAASAAEGFHALGSFRPDVLVCDIGMPNEDGYDFIRRIRALPADAGGSLPAIALTAYARHDDKNRALGLGFSAHIGKPVNPEDLLTKVGELTRPSAS